MTLNEAVAPDTVPSASFDATEYKELRRRYLEKRVRQDAELPSGVRLRKQTAPPAIETPGYVALRKEIQRLEKGNNHEQIHYLLKRLATWEETRTGPCPAAGTNVNRDGKQVVEIIDLTANDKEDRKVIDVDKYIREVLLVKGVKSEHGAKDDEQAPQTTTGELPSVKTEDEQVGDSLLVHKHTAKQATDNGQTPSSLSSPPPQKRAKTAKGAAKEAKDDTNGDDDKFDYKGWFAKSSEGEILDRWFGSTGNLSGDRYNLLGQWIPRAGRTLRHASTKFLS